MLRGSSGSNCKRRAESKRVMYTGDKISVKASSACMGFVIFALLLTYYAGFDSFHEQWDEVTSEISTHALGGIGGSECEWKAGDPVLYHMNTKLGVNYGGDHWFHVAENFMTQHSILEASNRNTDANVVYFDFDRSGFVAETTGMTKFMIALGALKTPSESVDKEYHFIHHSGIDLDSDGKESFHVLDHHDFHDHVKIILSGDKPATKERFIVRKGVDVHNDHESREMVCVKDLGVVGGEWPTPQRGHWFPKEGDIERFRKKIIALCPPDEKLLDKGKKQKTYKLVIYQRDQSRNIANEDEMIALLKSFLKEELWEIDVIYHVQDRSPCMLAHLLRQVDVVITPHGFQSMILLFLPRPSLLFEVFPYRYYKRGYAPLGNEYGIYHHGVMSPARSWTHQLLLAQTVTSECMQSKTCRNYGRNDNVYFTQHGLNRLKEAVEKLLADAKMTEKRDVLYV